jgi:outer membrane protein assembly factor BamB
MVYLPSTDGNLYALDAYSGVLSWKYASHDSIEYITSPSVANGLLFLSVGIGNTNQRKILALDARGGNLLWEYGNTTFGEPSVADGAVFVGDFFGNIYAFRITSSNREDDTKRPNPKLLHPRLRP